MCMPIIHQFSKKGKREVFWFPADENGEGGLGFTFQSYNADDFMAALKRALNLYNNNSEAFRALQKRGMDMDFSWNVPAGKYMELFEKMLSW